MEEEITTDRLELERLKLERLKVYADIAKVAITVALGTLAVTLVNSSIQWRQLEQQQLQNAAQLELQAKKEDADRRQAEMKYLGHCQLIEADTGIRQAGMLIRPSLPLRQPAPYL